MNDKTEYMRHRRLKGQPHTAIIVVFNPFDYPIK